MASQTLNYGLNFTFFNDSDILNAEPSVVRLLVSDLSTDQYFKVALLTVLVYYAVTTMDKEIKYFWCIDGDEA
ncbi:uncharacterized protein FOMMEDRAFT_159354 [Fomitiporia mediterranea MF3/22]|uniref:uncharacterized protein n=1 Tax=Fomitiporia mediterranea (strain MF3/22) TaxID=694068 RepID=UPI0004408910|nr:uncharacterized protein FOMMEDRAFT_159354 [Fomitiporia mediterranea MF3/22]EJD00606.1 hypothetical protein FOMMEDRAFT_159354 [Fomitiporia mediterranea MF3/22]